MGHEEAGGSLGYSDQETVEFRTRQEAGRASSGPAAGRSGGQALPPQGIPRDSGEPRRGEGGPVELAESRRSTCPRSAVPPDKHTTEQAWADAGAAPRAERGARTARGPGSRPPIRRGWGQEGHGQLGITAGHRHGLLRGPRQLAGRREAKRSVGAAAQSYPGPPPPQRSRREPGPRGGREAAPAPPSQAGGAQPGERGLVRLLGGSPVPPERNATAAQSGPTARAQPRPPRPATPQAPPPTPPCDQPPPPAPRGQAPPRQPPPPPEAPGLPLAGPARSTPAVSASACGAQPRAPGIAGTGSAGPPPTPPRPAPPRCSGQSQVPESTGEHSRPPPTSGALLPPRRKAGPGRSAARAGAVGGRAPRWAPQAPPRCPPLGRRVGRFGPREYPSGSRGSRRRCGAGLAIAGPGPGPPHGGVPAAEGAAPGAGGRQQEGRPGRARRRRRGAAQRASPVLHHQLLLGPPRPGAGQRRGESRGRRRGAGGFWRSRRSPSRRRSSGGPRPKPGLSRGPWSWLGRGAPAAPFSARQGRGFCLQRPLR